MSVLNLVRFGFKRVPSRHCDHFQWSILRRIFNTQGRKPSELGAMSKLIMGLRSRWVRLVEDLYRRGDTGEANHTTWSNRANCRPVLVEPSFKSHACTYLRGCPFCYARQCWREYCRLRKILFRGDSQTCWRKITAVTRRITVTCDTLEQVETRLRSLLTAQRKARTTKKRIQGLAELAGWFRSQKIWVERKDDSYRITMEMMVLGTSRGQKIPGSVFMQGDCNLRTKSVSFEKIWQDWKMTKQSFRKFMIRSMQYEPAWLSGDTDVIAVCNRVLTEMKFQQFYCGGELGKIRKQVDSSGDDSADA